MPVRVEKIIGSLPSTLDENTLYFVRTGTGFSLYFTDATGMIAHNLNSDNIAILNTQIKKLVEQNEVVIVGDSLEVAIGKLQTQLIQLAQYNPKIYNANGLLDSPKIFVGKAIAADGIWTLDISAAKFKTIYAVETTAEATGTNAGARRISGIAQNGISLNQLAGFMVKSDSAGLLAAMTLVNGEGPVYVTVYGD